MTKKISKIIAVVFMTLFIMGITKGSYAKSINSLTALGKDIEAINSKAETAYVIGNYVFTSGHDLEIQ